MTDDIETKTAKPVMTDEDIFNGLRVLEAVLFTAREPQTPKDLAAFFAPETDVELLLEHLRDYYANRGVNLVQRGRGWAFRTAPDLAEKLQIHKVETRPLSRAAIETLAITAYHQPVTRAEIEQIRGVSISKSTFEILVAEGLIKPGKRRDIPGRPLTWVTTQKFLDQFGLETLKQLPNLQELKDAGLLSMVPPQLAGLDPQAAFGLGREQDEVEEETDEAEDETDFEFSDNDDNTKETGEAA
jgi:segregation and condensation protein B